ncbi:MAG: hypothetical protein ACKOS8_19980 [Gemmataceae bacterium]
MKRFSITLALAGLFFATACQAGIYGSLEKPLAGAFPFAGLRLSLGELRGTEANDKTIPVEPGSLRAEYLALREKLEKAADPGPVDRMELAVARMRLGQPDAAMADLERLVDREELPPGDRFLGLLNLAACYAAQAGRQGDAAFLLRAVTTQRRALDAWPTSLSQAPKGWDFGTWRASLAAEDSQYKLWRSRLREGPGSFSTLKLEDLHGGPIPGAQKEYAAGPASPVFWREAFDDLALVQQLVLWNPTDNRLYWLYGEWLNARGEVTSARAVLEELVDARRLRNFPDLVNHWQILRSATEAIQPGQVATGESIGAVKTEEVAKNSAGLELPNGRTFLVGLGFGVILSLLAQMQWRALSRRRA